MAIETELKLRIAPAHMARLKRHPLLRSLSSERAVTRKLYSVYFDTPDLYLHNARMALRLRRSGKQWLQTLKGGGGVQAGLHQRNEWETPVPGEKLDFAALEAAGGGHLPSGVRKKLQPFFVTDFSRSIRMLQFEGAVIEMGLDSGEIRAGSYVHTISELELELKSGEPLQLFRLALALLDIVPLEIEGVSKAEYGYRLRSPVKTVVKKAQTPNFLPQTSLKAALQEMVWSCLSHLQANVPGALAQIDDEYLHQVRVALRRLRVVLRIVAKQGGDAELSALRESVAELASALGQSREWDVFITQTLPALHSHQDGELILRQSEKLRQHYHGRVLAVLQTGGFQRLLLRFGAWMNGAYWQMLAADTGLPAFAAKILRGQGRKVARYAAHIGQTTDARQLHVLRIACKNLRYSAELFAALYGAKKTASYMHALAGLQDSLGEFNDHAVALRLLDELMQEELLEGVAVLRERIEHRHDLRLSELRKAWKQFAKQSDFWE